MHLVQKFSYSDCLYAYQTNRISKNKKHIKYRDEIDLSISLLYRNNPKSEQNSLL
jgi:hypothetical protein